MIGIYEDVFYKVIQIEKKEGLHTTKTYKIDEQKYIGDIQPITEKAIKYTWGKQIKSKLQLFCSEDLLIDDYVINDNKIYKIEDKKDWKEYKAYAILEADLEIDL